MEPLFFPEDEQALLPQELHPTPNGIGSISITNLETGRRGSNTEGLGGDKPTGGGDGGGRGGEEKGFGIKRKHQRRGNFPYDRHSLHVVTQYYMPGDPSRAREVRASHAVGLDNLC